MQKITILGSGAWGTALATIAAKNTELVALWSRNSQVINDINAARTNRLYLPDVQLAKNIIATNDLKSAITNSNMIIAAVPAQYFRDMCQELFTLNLSTQIPIVICCKGIEASSLKLMSEVAEEIFGNGQLVAILSGPNFAHEIALGKPTAATIAAQDHQLATHVATSLSSEAFRLYASGDIISTQLSGAVKNILAIACGITIGKNLGENARAALITRGIAEIQRLCIAKGGANTSLLGLSGIGDIMLTCNSASSRNTSLGIELARGKTLDEILAGRITVAEGINSCRAVTELARQLGVEMPICQLVSDILFNNADIDQATLQLLARPLIDE